MVTGGRGGGGGAGRGGGGERGEGGRCEEQAWECPTVRFRACGLIVLVGELDWSLRRVTCLSQSGNTNILSTVHTGCTHMHTHRQLMFPPYVIWRLANLSRLLIRQWINLAACLSVSPSQQMSSLHFFQEQCLRRCIQETVAGAHFLCDRCAMEA